MFLRPHNCSRRDFLARTGAGFGAVALNALSNLNATAAERRQSSIIDPLNPYAPRAPHFRARAKSVIFLFMVGGPSHVETFDYKPELQELDGKPVPEPIRKAVE